MNFLSLLVITSILLGCKNNEPREARIEAKPLPSFKLLLPDSLTLINTKDIPTDKPIIFFYYGPQCPYSRAQMEEMLQDINEMKNSRIYLVTVWPFLEMKFFYTKYRLNKYSNVFSGCDLENYFGNYYKLTGVPFTVIYNGNKKLIKTFEGKAPIGEIIEAIKL